MDFRVVTSNKKKSETKTVSVAKPTIEKIIDLLSNVECTCVWSERDKEYLKIHEIDQNVVEELKTALALSAFQA